MKILLNTESLLPPLTGIGNYTLNLLRCLCEENEIEAIDCFSLGAFSPARETLARYAAQDRKTSARPTGLPQARLRTFIRGLPLAYRTRTWLYDLKLHSRAYRYRTHVYHEPNFILKNHAGPSVATIHDLSFIHYPQHHPAERVAWMKRQLPRTLARADLLITPSETIRQELIADHGVAANRVRAIYHGAADCFRPHAPEQSQPILQRYGLEHDRYLLFVASLEPRKGVDVLLDAWCALPDALRRIWPLVLAGAPGWKNRELLKRIERLQVSHGLRRLNFVPSEDLPALYAGASVFVYPALYEGFGLPVLEAMQSGVPVISTNETSMAEFAGDSISLVEPGNREQLTEHLQALLENDAHRNTLAVAGLRHSRNFSWKRCARETLDVYRAIVS